MYAGCLVLWKSQLQTMVALPTAKAKYIALSTALRETIPLLQLLREISVIMNISECDKKMKCTLFEDNNGALELAKAPKIRPRTKHIAIKYHHFRSFLGKGLFSIEGTDAAEQQADFLTKPLPETIFTYLRKKVMGW